MFGIRGLASEGLDNKTLKEITTVSGPNLVSEGEKEYWVA
jgi:hypothetical protein